MHAYIRDESSFVSTASVMQLLFLDKIKFTSYRISCCFLERRKHANRPLLGSLLFEQKIGSTERHTSFSTRSHEKTLCQVTTMSQFSHNGASG